MPQRMQAGATVIELRRREGVSKIFGIVGSSLANRKPGASRTLAG